MRSHLLLRLMLGALGCLSLLFSDPWVKVTRAQGPAAGTNEAQLPLSRLEFYRRSPGYYREPLRPQFHFTPELNWTNDPNGPVFFQGEYHLFYQFNPHGKEWGHMSWGHAVSPDLLHWQHLPIAIPDEYGLMAFSGSAVVDSQNTSGLFDSNPVPPGQGLVAIFTGHGHGLQTQDLAFSRDAGRTWQKFSGNPVLNLNKADFRDPKVWWDASAEKWQMVVSLAADKQVLFYQSSNLKDWTLTGSFGPAGVANKPNWECPDLFELPVEGEPGVTRWLLKTDIGSGSVAGGSGGEYFIGEFKDGAFHAESVESQWVDYGRDFYASASWNHVPANDGRRIWIGWMNNWETALNPTEPWRGAMSLPREVTLRRIAGKLRLCQQPVRELETLREKSANFEFADVKEGQVPLPLEGKQLDISVEFTPGTAQQVGLILLSGVKDAKPEETVVGYNVAQGELFIDRTRSGNVEFHPAFAGVHTGPLAPQANGKVSLRIVVDACSIEVFGNQGETVLTDLVFPGAASQGADLFVLGGTCASISGEMRQLQSVWPARK